MGRIAVVADSGMPYGEMVAPLIVAGVGVSMTPALEWEGGRN